MFYAGRGHAWVKKIIGDLLDRADRRLCGRADECARAYGWDVTRTGFGARRYHDPEFDLMHVDADHLGPYLDRWATTLLDRTPS
ncbi:hypothetical protein [Bailinhaonella thermotolerans]|uniref:Uncharacterized protein n=1 Tax=Bailinhaonella thermotolerans TaxID=1070861 RepID=A0A3A4A821_9ACTN|nr:hypothetical protein [Bailinhaonella thermotolerans]RJL24109.1 hypothetical protein D5H75_30095 [Bailinhaonella thermotolerans]